MRIWIDGAGPTTNRESSPLVLVDRHYVSLQKVVEYMSRVHLRGITRLKKFTSSILRMNASASSTSSSMSCTKGFLSCIKEQRSFERRFRVNRN